MNPWIGWALAVAAMVVGYTTHGAQGLVLAVTVVVFWLLLQFSRAMRVMRGAAQAPVGRVPSAVMLHAKLSKGMNLMKVLTLTRSLGRRLSGDANSTKESFAWSDADGHEVTTTFVNGKLTDWSLARQAAPSSSPTLADEAGAVTRGNPPSTTPTNPA
jgi:hypothetical protein